MGVAERARQAGQRPGGVAVGMLDDEGAEGRAGGAGLRLERGQDRRHPVAGVEVVQRGKQLQLLPCEHQRAPGQGARQRGRLGSGRKEADETAAAFGRGIAVLAGRGRALAQLGRELGLEAGAAVAQQPGCVRRGRLRGVHQ